MRPESSYGIPQPDPEEEKLFQPESWDIDEDNPEEKGGEKELETEKDRERKLKDLRDDKETLLSLLKIRPNFDEKKWSEIAQKITLEMLGDAEIVGEINQLLRQYRLSSEDMPNKTRDYLSLIHLGTIFSRTEIDAEDVTKPLEDVLRTELSFYSLDNLGILIENLESTESSPEKRRSEISEIMERLRVVSEKIPSKDGYDDYDHNDMLKEYIQTRFKQLTDMRRADDTKPEVRKAIEEIFEDNSDFIEGTLFEEYLKWEARRRGMAEIETALGEFYDRSPEETEKIKERNRKSVAEEIERMAKEPAVTVTMIERLHAANNRNIVPKKYSKFRNDPNEFVTFDKRLAVFGEHVSPEMEDLVERLNKNNEEENVDEASRLRFLTEAVSIQNDFVEIHPFSDRNGSTSLLLLELMMAKKGYEPPKTREKDGLKNLARITENDPVMIKAITDSIKRHAEIPGFYESKRMSEEDKKQYRRFVKRTFDFPR